MKDRKMVVRFSVSRPDREQTTWHDSAWRNRAGEWMGKTVCQASFYTIDVGPFPDESMVAAELLTQKRFTMAVLGEI